MGIIQLDLNELVQYRKKTSDQIKVTLVDQSPHYQKNYEPEGEYNPRVYRSLKAVGELVGALGISAIGIDFSQIHTHALVRVVTNNQTITNSNTGGNPAFMHGNYADPDTNYITLIHLTNETTKAQAIVEVDLRTENISISLII